MKVTTDACIQGAWTAILPGVNRVLDIGAGTGLLSLMLAQRAPNAIIDAIEYDSDAAAQASANAALSPWKKRINVIEGDICSYQFPAKYDLIIVNPPFFNNSLLSDDADKNRARHTISLTYYNLLKALEENLATDGYASVMLPYPEYLGWKVLLDASGWFEFDKLLVSHRADAPVKRVVSLFSRKEVPHVIENKLVIQDDKGQYTPAFTDLLAPFYLDL